MERLEYNQAVYVPPSTQQALSYIPNKSSSVAIDAKNYPMFGIDFPGKNDIMCGRGGESNTHVGNVRFRSLISDHKIAYLSAGKSQKPEMAMNIVNMWRGQSPPGRFLAKTNPKSEDSLWHDVGDRKAKEKVSQCLREKTPEIMPFLGQLEQLKHQQQEMVREKESSHHDTGMVKTHPTVPTREHFVAPDQAQPIVPLVEPTTSSRQQNNRQEKKGRSRPEIAKELPTAAELLDVFEDESMAGQRAYYDEVRTFLASLPKGNDETDAYWTANHSQLMDNMSACSWIRSVKSVGSDGGGTMLMSLVDGMLNTCSAEKPSTSHRPKMPKKVEIATRSQKMSNFGKVNNKIGESSTSNVSDITDLSSFRDKSMRSTKMSTAKGNNVVNTSFMSDLTDFSSFRETNNKSQRSSKMESGKRENSNYSMLSELTDISEGVQDMSIGR
jgi:hypothetical protein